DDIFRLLQIAGCQDHFAVGIQTRHEFGEHQPGRRGALAGLLAPEQTRFVKSRSAARVEPVPVGEHPLLFGMQAHRPALHPQEPLKEIAARQRLRRLHAHAAYSLAPAAAGNGSGCSKLGASGLIARTPDKSALRSARPTASKAARTSDVSGTRAAWASPISRPNREAAAASSGDD